jgi:hypothetical protein
MSEEKHLEGAEFLKWSNNAGYLLLSEVSATLQAFSHWTWSVTEHEMMVVDLQGVYTGAVSH